MHSQDFQTRSRDGATIVTTPWGIDHSNAHIFHLALMAAGTEGPVTVDMANTAYADRTGLLALIWVSEWLKATGGDLRVTGPEKMVSLVSTFARHDQACRELEINSRGLTTWQLNGVSVVTAQQELDINAAGLLHHALMTATAGGAVVVDMAATTFCDSSGLLPMTWIAQWLQFAGGDLRVACPDPRQRLIMRLTKDDRTYRVFDSLPEALRTWHPRIDLTVRAAA